MDESRQAQASVERDANAQPARTPDPTAQAQSTSQGRAIPVRSANWSGVLAEQGYVVGANISGAGERVVLVDLNGNVVARNSFLRPAEGVQQPSEVTNRVAGMIRGMLDSGGIKDREILRIGVGFGGPVDARSGVVRESYSAPGWTGFKLGSALEKAFDVPILVDNDARLAALGEVWFGAGQGASTCNLVYLHWSTGVGGGLVTDGKLMRGCESLAGEIGHTAVRWGPDALPCRCGGRGHLESYVRSAALVERARDAYQAAGRQAPENLTVQEIFGRAQTDPVLGAVVSEAIDMIAFTLGNLITAINPDLVVLGGRVARDCSQCIPAIAKLAPEYTMPLSAKSVQIVPAALGEDSGVLGAVALALESLQ